MVCRIRKGNATKIEKRRQKEDDKRVTKRQQQELQITNMEQETTQQQGEIVRHASIPCEEID